VWRLVRLTACTLALPRPGVHTHLDTYTYPPACYQVSRKHLLEHVVPTVVSLKACLERAHSPLLRDVMGYLAELIKAHKEEVKEALSADPQVFHEVEYDLQQFEKANVSGVVVWTYMYVRMYACMYVCYVCIYVLLHKRERTCVYIM
jgi:hypothetical protein